MSVSVLPSERSELPRAVAARPWLRLAAAVVTLALAIGVVPGVSAGPAHAAAVRQLAGFTTNVLPANDDGSTGLVPIGFTVDFFGTNYPQLYVNNNGNVTFDSALGIYTPFDLTSTGRIIIAPFFGDVDTRGGVSALVTYGNDVVNGRPACGGLVIARRIAEF